MTRPYNVTPGIEIVRQLFKIRSRSFRGRHTEGSISVNDTTFAQT